MEGIKKDFDKGQHFLIDKEIIEKGITVSNISKKDRVIEIGAGAGSLTGEITKRAGKVLAFEIDKRYAKELESLKEKNKNLKIIYGNAFNYSWKGYTKIVSNAPFYISESLINKAINDGIPELVLIVGEKFKKILEENQTKIGIIANLFYDIEFIMKIDKECFSPIPKVNSWIVRFEKKKKFSYPESIFLSVLKRKGKLKNALLYSLVEKGKTKRESKKILEDMNLYKNNLENPASKITGKLLMRLIKELEKANIIF